MIVYILVAALRGFLITPPHPESVIYYNDLESCRDAIEQYEEIYPEITMYCIPQQMPKWDNRHS